MPKASNQAYSSPLLPDFEQLANQLADGLYVVDKDRRILFWNQAAELITGFSAQEVVGRYCHENILQHTDQKDRAVCINGCPLLAVIERGKKHRCRLFLRHKNGRKVAVEVRTAPLTDRDGEIIGATEIFSDISRQLNNETRLKKLADQALLDELTSLPNRRHLLRELSLRCAEMHRHKVNFGLLFIDIDHFKNINDKYGHDAGDLVLKQLSDCLSQALRNGDMLGRWGGEEFVAVMPRVSPQELKIIAQRLSDITRGTLISIGSHHSEKPSSGNLDIICTLSIGATISCPTDSPETIVRRADQLMYQAKLAGRDRVIYDL